MAGTALAPATLNKSSKRKNHPSEIHTSLKTQLLFSLAASDEPGEQSGQARECRSHASDSLAAAPACTDRHGRMVERNALVAIDTIFNTACVKGGVRDRETAIGVDGKSFPGARLDLAAARDVNAVVSPNRRFSYRACLYLAPPLMIRSLPAAMP